MKRYDVATVVRALVSLLLLAAPAGQPRPGDLIWQSSEALDKGANRTFVAVGTRRGTRYLFRARGVCETRVWTRNGWTVRARSESIFGIDFRITFGSGEKQVLNVGDKKPEQTELAFVADGDDVPIRIRDNWDLPEKVSCTVDGFEVVVAPTDR